MLTVSMPRQMTWDTNTDSDWTAGEIQSQVMVAKRREHLFKGGGQFNSRLIEGLFSYLFLKRSWTAEHGRLWLDDGAVCGAGGNSREGGGEVGKRVGRGEGEEVNTSMYSGSNALRREEEKI